ncbi:MAG: 2-phospho-L-lactate guanylyltransferase [Acetobacteraceae bacterium]|nr:2-phospho-L-lactate guanylyltransferase [Acetobacteraceae bacterium]
MTEVWAAVPVKSLASAKQRLAGLLTPTQREALAAAMLEDVLEALAAARLGGIVVNTVDAHAAALVRRYDARVIEDGALHGHTGAVNGIARLLEREGREAMLAMPGDIPRVTTREINAVLAARGKGRSFTIVPARDEQGSNAVLCAPPLAVPLRFGDDSYFPHLDAARRQGIEPKVVRLPGIGLDIDRSADVRAFLAARPRMATRTLRLLEAAGV